MKSERRTPASTGMDVYISAESSISGNLQTQSNIVIEGQVDGSVSASGNVHIGANARVEGNITAADVQIAGVVNGNITSTGGIILFAGAKLTGDIQACGLTVEKGAYYSGVTVIVTERAKENEQP